MSADKDYLSLPLRTFLADLAARTATPGGGSVAATAGLLAAAQARMVVEYTVGKPKFASHEARLQEALQELRRAEEAFGRLMSEDMAAYERVSASRKVDDPMEKQRAIGTAAAVPMEIAALAEVMLALLDDLKTRVNPHLLSDLKVAAIMALSAARCAALNVEVNLPGLTDRPSADRVASQLRQILDHAQTHRNAIVHHEPR